jgi:hypothetical protein
VSDIAGATAAQQAVASAWFDFQQGNEQVGSQLVKFRQSFHDVLCFVSRVQGNQLGSQLVYLAMVSFQRHKFCLSASTAKAFSVQPNAKAAGLVVQRWW